MASVAVRNRGYIRSQVTRLFNEKETWNDMNSEDKASIKLKLQDYSKQLEKLNANIQAENLTNEQFDFNAELENCDNYNDRIRDSLSVLNRNNTTVTINNTQSNLLKYPQIPLPKFSGGEGENLSKFLFEFDAAVSRYKLTDYDNLLLLKQQLSGRAMYLINSLETNNQNYTQAVNLFKRAFECKEMQICNILKQLSNLKLSRDDDPYQYISKVRNLQETLVSLKVTVNDFLHFFVWEGFNSVFKKHFISVTNQTRPSFDIIMDN